jgi:ATP-dependent Zn protease
MVDNLHCDTEQQLITMSLTHETDGFITTSINSTEVSVNEGSGVGSTEIIVDNEIKEFNSTEKAFIQPATTENDDWILITIIVGSLCGLAVVGIVAVICIRRHRNSREETSGHLSRTNSIDYLNQEDQFSRKYKNARNDNIKNHNNYDRVSRPDFSNGSLQFKVGSTVAAEVVRVPSFKTRGVAAPLNLPEEIRL